MAWCRFSPDSKTSDLYIYESDDGVMIHVAKKRMRNPENIPIIPVWSEENKEEFLKKYNERVEWLKNHKEDFIDIGLPYDGATFVCHSKEGIIETLDTLKELGYNFPDEVFELAEEYNEQ